MSRGWTEGQRGTEGQTMSENKIKLVRGVSERSGCDLDVHAITSMQLRGSTSSCSGIRDRTCAAISVNTNVSVLL